MGSRLTHFFWQVVPMDDHDEDEYHENNTHHYMICERNDTHVNVFNHEPTLHAHHERLSYTESSKYTLEVLSTP